MTQRRLLDGAAAGNHDDETLVVIFLNRQNRADTFVSAKWQEIHNRFATRAATRLRNLVNLEPVHLAKTGETQQRVMRIGNEQAVDEIFVLHFRCRSTPPAAFLRLIIVDRLSLGIAAVRQRHHDFFLRDQVFGKKVAVVLHYLGTPLIAVRVAHHSQLFADNPQQLVRVRQDNRILINFRQQLFVFI